MCILFGHRRSTIKLSHRNIDHGTIVCADEQSAPCKESLDLQGYMRRAKKVSTCRDACASCAELGALCVTEVFDAALSWVQSRLDVAFDWVHANLQLSPSKIVKHGPDKT